jgi:hypothetical protein
LSWHSAFASRGPRRHSHATSSALVAIDARIAADLYDSGCSVLAAVTFPDQVVL